MISNQKQMAEFPKCWLSINSIWDIFHGKKLGIWGGEICLRLMAHWCIWTFSEMLMVLTIFFYCVNKCKGVHSFYKIPTMKNRGMLYLYPPLWPVHDPISSNWVCACLPDAFAWGHILFFLELVFFSCNTVFYRSTHSDIYKSSSLFLRAEYYSMVWVYHSWFNIWMGI